MLIFQGIQLQKKPFIKNNSWSCIITAAGEKYRPMHFFRQQHWHKPIKISLTNFNYISLKHTLHQHALQTLDHVIIIQQIDHEEMSNCQVCFALKRQWACENQFITIHSFFYEIKRCPTSLLSIDSQSGFENVLQAICFS